MIRNKFKYYKDYSKSELIGGFISMLTEVEHLGENHPISVLLKKAKTDFICGKFSYDGATFMRERNENTVFDVRSFIHDWRNSQGYVSYEVDNEMMYIMQVLGYKQSQLFWTYFLTRFTFLNIIRHKLKGTYKGSEPIDIFRL